MTKRLGALFAVVALVGLPLDLGCAASARTGGDGSGVDAGVGVFDRDADGALDASGPATVDGGGGPAPAEVPDDSLANEADYARACLDGIDADRAGGLDCADPECAAAPSCCVGSTSTACCSTSAPIATLDFTTCTDAHDCGAPAVVVGAPSLSAGLVATVSDGATADAGLLLTSALDLRSGHVRLEASAVVGPAGATVDALAFGFYPAEAGGARSLPIAALQLSASRAEAAIVAGDTLVATAPLSASASAETWSLSLDPDGSVRATGPGLDLTAHVVVPGALVRVGVLGRSESSTSAPVRLASLTVNRAGCDVPGALTPVPFVLEDSTGLYDEGSVAGPAFSSDGARRVIAFDAVLREDGRRAIFVGIEDDTRPGVFVVEATATRTQPVLRSGLTIDAVSEPALSFDGTAWTLYGTGITNGRRVIVATRSADAELAFGVPMVLEAPPADRLDDVSPERDGAAILPGSTSMILAREHTPSGPAIVVLDVAGALAGYVSGVCDADTESCAEDPSGRSSRVVLARRFGTLNFDADEVAAPSVAYHRGVYRLYYAGRRGLRWSIGVAISADARYWRRLDDDVVLGPTGNGPAAVGTLDPDIHIASDGTADLFYTAWNGIDTTLLRATQVVRR